MHYLEDLSFYTNEQFTMSLTLIFSYHDQCEWCSSYLSSMCLFRHWLNIDMKKVFSLRKITSLANQNREYDRMYWLVVKHSHLSSLLDYFTLDDLFSLWPNDIVHIHLYFISSEMIDLFLCTHTSKSIDVNLFDRTYFSIDIFSNCNGNICIADLLFFLYD